MLICDYNAYQINGPLCVMNNLYYYSSYMQCRAIICYIHLFHPADILKYLLTHP